MASFDDPEVIFRRRFKRVFREIEFLERKINKKEGWIFTNHLHSKEELLNSEHHKMIYSITEKIGDDAENWYGRGKLPESGKELYYEYREETDDKLHEVNLSIEDREPTWWESAKGSLEEFVEWVMENMPDLKRLLLTAGETLAKLPGPIGKIGSMIMVGLNNIIKKLPSNKNKRLEYDQ
jgi:hypothetical protein